MCGDIIIQIADFPDDQIIEDMGLETPFDLLGLLKVAASANVSACRRAKAPIASRSTAVRSSTIGPNMKKRWAISSPMF